jgi:hypothetical protein
MIKYSKDEKEKIKLMEKQFEKLFRTIANKHKWKSRGWAFYKIENDFFFTGYTNSTLFLENKIEIYLYLMVKPFIIDEIFWEIFDLKENKKMSVGLRANGAFVIKGHYLLFAEEVCYNETEHLYENWEKIITENIKTMDDKIKRFLSEGWTLENFDKYKDTTSGVSGDEKLIEILLLIIKKEYTKAYEIVCNEIDEKRRSMYGGSKGDSYIYIKEYCENYLIKNNGVRANGI